MDVIPAPGSVKVKHSVDLYNCVILFSQKVDPICMLCIIVLIIMLLVVWQPRADVINNKWPRLAVCTNFVESYVQTFVTIH